mmetsp:Transcript_12043/g.15703  ORF Transcript_12043/g.15703 Transcript_12043/m.15703 type:complete len:184 (-) Transcript_12043:33-584(-)
MSLDQRCQQFHEACLGVGKSKGPTKEIATLRKFLHKNQDQRFTDKAVSRVFDTVQIYVCNADISIELKEGLLEDCLKMPFTVFSTKQKQKMIKMLQGLRNDQQEELKDDDVICLLSVLDLDGDDLSLLDEISGLTYVVEITQGVLSDQIRELFKKSEDSEFYIRCKMENKNKTAVSRMLELVD